MSLFPLKSKQSNPMKHLSELVNPKFETQVPQKSKIGTSVGKEKGLIFSQNFFP